MGILDRMKVMKNWGVKQWEYKEGNQSTKRKSVGRLTPSFTPNLACSGPGWYVKELTGWWVPQREAELIRPQGRGQLRPGGSAYHWGLGLEKGPGHIILTQG